MFMKFFQKFVNLFVQRNERREREQRELAKLALKSGVTGSEEGSSPRMSDSHSITDSDTYTPRVCNFFISSHLLQAYLFQ